MVESKLGVTTALVVGVLLVTEAISFWNTYRLNQALQRTEHTIAVEGELDGIFSAVVDVEAGQLGFAISGERRFLERMEGGLPEAWKHFGKVAELTGDNPHQQERLPELKRHLEARFSYAREVVSLRTAQGFESVQALIAGGTGLEKTNAVRAMVAEMKALEEDLMKARSRAVRARTNATLALNILLVALLSAAVVSIYLYIRSDFRSQRLAAEALNRSQQEIRNNNLFLDAIIENIPHMIIVKDAETLAFKRLNRAGEALLGQGRERLLGKTDYEVFPKAEADYFVAKDRETLRNREVMDISELPIHTTQGLRWLHTIKVPIVGDRGEPRFLLAISEDITERKGAADDLWQSKERAEASNRELESFSYSVSHDLRAPLRSIDGFSQALLEDYRERLDQTGQDYLSRIRRASQRMAQLIDDLLGLSRVTRSAMQRERIDLSALAESILENLGSGESDRKVTWRVAEDLWADGDVRLIRIVLENLLRNAWKFTSRGEEATIEMGATDRDNAHVYWIRDNGAGFDMRYVDKLFGAFQRLHSAADFEGTGIGLATVQRIIRRHGGKVWAEGQVSQGATFYFTVPPRMEKEA